MEDVLDILGSVVKIAGDAKTMGALAALTAFVFALVRFSKTGMGQRLLDKISLRHKWLRPIIAAALGFLSGALGALAVKAPWMTVLLSGLGGMGLGFAATGAHEAAVALSSSERERRAAAGAIESALMAEDDKVKERVEAVKTKLDEAAALTDKKARLKAMAAWAVANPPR